MINRREIDGWKELVSANKIELALDTILAEVEARYPLFEDEVRVLKSGFYEIEKSLQLGLMDQAQYLSARNKHTIALLRLIKQLPTEEDVSHGPARGVLCHNIPGAIPLGTVTKCVIKIAENEQILGVTGPDTHIEHLGIAQEMDVQMTDGGSRAFEINPLTDIDQYLQVGAATSWVYLVKPLRAGSHTLYLTVKTIQRIDGVVKKRNTVLEKHISVAAEVPAETEAAAWADTGLRMEEGRRRRGGLAGFFNRFRLATSVLLLLMTASVLAFIGRGLVFPTPEQVTEGNRNDSLTVIEVVPESEVVPEEEPAPPPAIPATDPTPPAGEPPGKVTAEPPGGSPPPGATTGRSVPSVADTPATPPAPPPPDGERTTYRISSQSTNLAFVSYGETMTVQIRLEAMDPDDYRLFLDGRSVEGRVLRRDSDLLLRLPSREGGFTLTLLNRVTGERHSRNFSGSKNARWLLRRLAH